MSVVSESASDLSISLDRSQNLGYLILLSPLCSFGGNFSLGERRGVRGVRGLM